MSALDMNARYRVKRWPVVAVYISGYPKRWEPCIGFYVDDDGNECEEEIAGEGEWIEDTECGQVLVIMVGDDRKHTVDVDDLIPLDELAYCAECGQIGCSHDGRERE